MSTQELLQEILNVLKNIDDKLTKTNTLILPEHSELKRYFCLNCEYKDNCNQDPKDCERTR